MPGNHATDHTPETLGARLTIAAVLDELRADPEGFARLLVAIAEVRQTDAAKLARLLAATSTVGAGSAASSPSR